MVTDVYIVYNDDSQIERLGDTKVSPFFHFIDDRTREGRKQGFKLKGSLSAKLTPFVVCKDKDTVIKAFYSEASKDVISELIKFLNQ